MAIKVEIEDGVLIVSDGTDFLASFEMNASEDGTPMLVEDVPPKVFSFIEKIEVDDFPQGLSVDSNLVDYLNFMDYLKYNWIDIKRGFNSQIVEIEITLSIDLVEWAQPFKVMEFIESFLNEVTSEKISCKFNGIEDGSAYIHIFREIKGKYLISDIVTELILHSEKAYNIVTFELSKRVQEQILVKVFNFPDNYQFVCTQYLIWFGELLSDLGIKANIHSEQNGTQTKIILAPENAVEVMTEVERLFHMYLSLPYSELLPVASASTYEKTVVMNLQAQITNFQTQIQLKDAIIEIKTATITNLASELEKKSKDLLLINSLQDDIEIFNGCSIGTIEWGPIKINPRRILENFK